MPRLPRTLSQPFGIMTSKVIEQAPVALIGGPTEPPALLPALATAGVPSRVKLDTIGTEKFDVQWHEFRDPEHAASTTSKRRDIFQFLHYGGEKRSLFWNFARVAPF